MTSLAATLPPMPKDQLTAKEIAKRYGVTKGRIHQLAAERGIKGEKIGNLLVFTSKQAEALRPVRSDKPDRSK